MDFFSPDYLSARNNFRAAATAAGVKLSALPVPGAGAAGEHLATDIAWLGPPTAEKLLLHCSGLHGVEGFAGAAIQLQLLRQPPKIAADCALLLVHVLNPYGMSWLRRANENNVDLNRNFIFADQPRPQPAAAYLRLDPLLNSAYPPRFDGFYAKLIYHLLRCGYPTLKAAIACGQYRFPRGLFYGGEQLEPGALLYHDWLQAHLSAPRRLLVLDLHTGLGRPGQESLLQSLAATPADLLSQRLATRVSPDHQETKVLGYKTSGGHEQLYARLFPVCEIDFITHEFGTRPALQVLKALRAENQWHHYGAGNIDHPTKQQLKEAFCLPERAWRQRIVERGRRLVEQGLKMLAEDRD